MKNMILIISIIVISVIFISEWIRSKRMDEMFDEIEYFFSRNWDIGFYKLQTHRKEELYF